MHHVLVQVRARIASLQLNTSLESPELTQLGLRMELDPSTARMRVVQTEHAKALAEEQMPGRQ